MGKIKCFIRDVVVRLCGGYPRLADTRYVEIHHDVLRIHASVTFSYAASIPTTATLDSGEKMMVAQRLAAELVPHIAYRVERNLQEPCSYTITGDLMIVKEGGALVVERTDNLQRTDNSCR